jgi:hypothetical protein
MTRLLALTSLQAPSFSILPSTIDGNALSISQSTRRSTNNGVSTVRNKTKSPLLRLPAELRNYIYRLALETASFTMFEFEGDSVRLIRHDLELPKVCRQINAETKPFLHTFSVLSLRAGAEWAAQEFDNLVNALDHHRFCDMDIQELRLCDTMTYFLLGFMTDSARNRHMWGQADRNCLPQPFASLDRLIVTAVRGEAWYIDESDVTNFRTLFGRPGLVVLFAVYGRNGSLGSEANTYIKTVATWEELGKEIDLEEAAR